jgi:hypothetical protein
MKMRKLILFLAVVFCMHIASAQKKIVLEKLRCLSSTGPTMSYLKDEGIRKMIARQLSQTLVQLGYPALADSNRLTNLEFPARITDLNTNDISFSSNDTSDLHLYLDFYEVSPDAYFSAFAQPTGDTSMFSRARSVFLLRAGIFNSNKKQLFAEELNVVISGAESIGIGIPYYTKIGQLSLTQKGFTELFRSSMQILLDPNNQLSMIEMKASPAFIVDDYILPKILNRPRTFITSNKNISRYTYNNKTEMLRLGDAMYEEIILKGKKALKYPDDITEMIKSRVNYINSDFVFLRQECRDVIRDKNYLIKLCAQIDPQNMREEPYTFTNFLPLDFHYLLLENDTVAKFTIQNNVVDDTKKIYPAKVSNGIDSSSIFTITVAQQPYAVRYEYVVKGMIAKKQFTIKCSGNRNMIKEIYLGDQLVCIAQGKFSPEKFVVFDASLSSEILNPLLMIGFNRFFE